MVGAVVSENEEALYHMLDPTAKGALPSKSFTAPVGTVTVYFLLPDLGHDQYT
jgi:hypothetical protein